MSIWFYWLVASEHALFRVCTVCTVCRQRDAARHRRWIDEARPINVKCFPLFLTGFHSFAYFFYFLQSDAKAGFLRSARDGHLEKILEHLKNNTDINTCNNVTSLTIIIHCIIFAWCNYSLFNICRVRVVLIYVKSSINMQTEWCWNVRETAFHRLITFSFSHL